MKAIQFILIALLVSSVACNSQTAKKAEITPSTEKIEAYYFHFNTRCVTCKAVEAEAKADLKSLYGDKVNFRTVNLDEAAGKELGDKLQVAGQTLLVMKGSKKINLTNEGFMYARTNPEKFKLVIKENIDKIM